MRKLIMLLLVVMAAVSAYADGLLVAGGAGYKTLVEDWANLYESTTGKKIERMYGNMGQVTAQVKLGGGICAVVGEDSFLKSSGINFASYNPIGKGILVLAYRKGLTIASEKDLLKPEFAKVAIPDVEKAIYGKAGKQLLTNTGMMTEIEPKLIPAGTVPRSGSYVLTGEADAAFINITFANANKDKLGSFIVIEKGYTPLEITAAVLPECTENAELKSFLGLLSTPEMKQIVKKNGL
jgi:molybdate transport system substrate-binding protein